MISRGATSTFFKPMFSKRAQLITADMAEAEGQVVDPVVDLFQPHAVFVQGVADKDLGAKHADRATAANPAHQVMGGVLVGLDALGHASGGGLVDLRRSLHGQRFVRADFIELLSKPVELLLLGS